MNQIGPYKIIRSIAKGGMGEVFLAFDPDCKREIAIKRIRSEYTNNKIIHKRFVKEALIASQLTHPNIISIYNLYNNSKESYYTMPYVQGKTLKQILIEAKEQKKVSGISTSQETSVPYLVSIFTTVCEAVAFAHSHQIIHRDLKPENVLVGKHGEVIIFDWGVADKIDNIKKEDPIVDLEELDLTDLTSPGKVIGTLSFLAPERFDSKLSNFLTDIYSLGVMLYVILTLRLPFKRKKLKDVKKNLHREVFRNPIEIAPYRDIPHALVAICKKCLQPDPKRRYQSMQELIKELRDFTEGRSDWEPVTSLSYNEPNDWQFHENLLVSNHQALSVQQSALEWISLMISKKSFQSNVLIDIGVRVKNKGQGIGLLLNSPPAAKRVHIIDGYYLWLSADPQKPSLLFRNNVEVLRLPHTILQTDKEYQVRLSKMHHRIECSIDGNIIFSYVSYLPLIHSHVGLLHKDSAFQITRYEVYSASPSLIISCLDVPEAFIEEGLFEKALTEYRRIGKAFSGRHESREALFRAGLALLELGKRQKTKKLASHYREQALKEFEHLRHTPGAPLEYLGKALVYQEQKDSVEELKCLELGLRRYPQHPLLYLIYDQIIYRLYQSSHHKRLDTHKFIFLALRYNAYAKQKQAIDPLILNLTDRRKMLFFLEESNSTSLQSHYLEMIINLAFLLEKHYVYEEILDSYTLDAHFIRNILILIWHMGKKQLFRQYLPLLAEGEQSLLKKLLSPVTQQSFDFLLERKKNQLSPLEENLTLILLETCLCQKEYNLAAHIFDQIEKKHLTLSKMQDFAYYEIITLLLNDEVGRALNALEKDAKLFEKNPHRHLFLKGLLAAATQKEKEAHTAFKQEMETSLPNVDMLGSLYLSGQLDYKNWKKEAFFFERAQLYKQLFFYYTLSKNSAKARYFHNQWKKIK